MRRDPDPFGLCRAPGAGLDHGVLLCITSEALPSEQTQPFPQGSLGLPRHCQLLLGLPPPRATSRPPSRTSTLRLTSLWCWCPAPHQGSLQAVLAEHFHRGRSQQTSSGVCHLPQAWSTPCPHWPGPLCTRSCCQGCSCPQLPELPSSLDSTSRGLLGSLLLRALHSSWDSPAMGHPCIWGLPALGAPWLSCPSTHLQALLLCKTPSSGGVSGSWGPLVLGVRD